MALRYSRPVKALIAAGIAASTIVMAGLPAAADTVRNGEWWMSALGVRDAWPVSRGAGITVAVLSDGVDAQQPDVTGPRLTIGPDFTGTGQSSGQYYGEIGTGIAALIGGHGYGLQGDSGVLGEVPSAQILSVRVTLPPGDPLLTQTAVAARLPGAIARGIRYAVSKGATVIDLPLDPGQAGVSGQAGASAAVGGSAAEAAAVRYALSHNVALVAPAGDDNASGDAPNFPAAYPGVIAVGAFNKDFVKAPWSSHQSYVTVTAAGSGLLLPTNSRAFTSQSSTVYASAVVAGIVAMMQGRFPGITVAQVRKALIAGAMFRRAGGVADGSGYGAVNAQQALTAAEAELTSPASLAGASTQAHAALPSPKPVSTRQRMVTSIIKDAVIAAVLLVILLLLIALYAATGRRRAARKREAVAAGWSNSAQRRNSRAGSTDADRMLEYFAAPVAGQALARPGAAPAAPPVASGAYPVAGLSAAISRDPFGPVPAQPQGTARDAADGRPSLGAASRPVTRRPAVSGAPPWEDASRPEGDLPWVAAPGPSATPSAPSAPSPPGVPSATSAPGFAGQAAATVGAGLPGRDLAAFRRGSSSAEIASADADVTPFSLDDLPSRSAQSGPQPGMPGPAAPGPFAAPPDGAGRALSPTGGGLWDRPAAPPLADAYRPAFGQADFSQADFSQTAPSQPTFSQLPPSQPTFSQTAPSQPSFSPMAPSQPSFSPLAPSEPTFSQTAPSQPDFSQPDFSQAPADSPASADAAGSIGEQPPGPEQSAQWRGLSRPGQSLTGRLDWGQQPAFERPSGDLPARHRATDDAGLGSPQLQAPGGPLPVRQPRQSAPSAAMSPSGSLWERAAEPAEAPAEDPGDGSRPIFVWNPGGTDGADSGPAELAADAPKWRLRHRQEHRPGS